MVICIVTEHLRLMRFYLLAVGLWPYYRTNLVRLQFFLCFSILLSFVIFQLTPFLVDDCTVNIIIKNLSITSYFSIYMIAHVAGWASDDKIKGLLEHLQLICNQLKDENEFAIIKKYGNHAKRYAAVLTSFSMCSMFGIIVLPFWPRILTIVSLINESQTYAKVQITTEYFINQEKYFYLILLHLETVLWIGTSTLMGIGLLLLGYCQHMCGIFSIASYRIEHAMSMLENSSLDTELKMYKEMTYAIDIHCTAIKYSELLTLSFENICLPLALLIVISTSMNLFGIFKNMLIEGDIETCMLHVIIIGVLFILLYLLNSLGQDITDHSNYVLSTAYNVKWYIAPLRIQKLLLVLLQRGNKTFTLTIAKMLLLSRESFATLTKASISYFTILYSMQQ
ncbi:hypothetical protein DMN91_006139 [Ooceraea biroi]|uniref:Odorant receptor n=2 Tax=Ooceraea biroi TaxID=2015173 RepID=A0A3L8DNG7_OOCBI|nr:uncharacterized protein LOC105286960 isoform X1 [Ooceraea biroi]RLU21763.1 hypothetical protein DMN91_006139 [Ooceraea biroi]